MPTTPNDAPMPASAPGGWELPRPEVSPADAERVAAERFGVAGAARELGSQQDRNFLVAGDAGAIVLKFDNPATPVPAILAQHRALAALAEHGVPAAQPIAGVDGRQLQEAHVGGITLACRAFPFLAGGSLDDEGNWTDATPAELGDLAGRVSLALAGLEVPERAHQWDLRATAHVVDRLLQRVRDTGRRMRVRSATERALDAIAPLARSLPVQTLHGDLTDDNAIRPAGDPANLAVIDLGDLGPGWRVAELAVALTAVVKHHPGDERAVMRAVRAFEHRVALTPAERRALWPLVVVRGAVLVVSGESQLAIDPDNAYAARRVEAEWAVFDAAERMARAGFGARLELLPPGGHGLDTLLGPGASWVPLDLSVTSPLLDEGRWLEPDAEVAAAQRARGDAAAVVVPYGTRRLTRTRPCSPVEPETASLHTELFTRPGQVIRTPVEGRVVDVSDTSVGVETPVGVFEVEGVRVAAEAGQLVAPGAPLGVAPGRRGMSRIRVRVRDARDGQAPWFCAPADWDRLSRVSRDPSPMLGLAPAPLPEPEARRQRQRRAEAVIDAQERYFRTPPQIELGWRAHLIDTSGRAYLDLVNNVTAIGHSHPRLTRAVADQLARLNTNSRFLYRALADAVALVRASAPHPSLDTVLFVNSGSEAVDLALRLARAATGREDVVAVGEAYHGWTVAADAVSTSAYDNPAAVGTRPHWVHVADAPNPYRGAYRGADAAAGYLRDLDETLDRLEAAGSPVGAFICETVLGNAGGVVPPDGYLAGAYARIRERGGLAIADEVQVGMGRTGETFWAVEAAGAVPDVLVAAKAVGNAYPVGFVLTRREIADALGTEGMFFSSAAGTPVGATVVGTVLEVIADEDLQGNARRVGAHLRGRLLELASRRPEIGAVHGRGLYLGVELVTDRETLEPATGLTARVCEAMLARGVVVQPASERQNVLKVKPPLCLTEAEADFFVDQLEAELSAFDHAPS